MKDDRDIRWFHKMLNEHGPEIKRKYSKTDLIDLYSTGTTVHESDVEIEKPPEAVPPRFIKRSKFK